MEQVKTTINFFMKRNRTSVDGQAPIYVRLTIRGVRKEVATNLKITEKVWNQKYGRCIGNSDVSKATNRRLEMIRIKLMEICSEFALGGKLPTADAIIDVYTGGHKKTVQPSLIELFEEHNERCEKLSGIDVAPGTIESYKTSLKHTREFLKFAFNKTDIELENINHQFIEKYELWLKTERGCNHNTSVKYLRNFQKILRIGVSRNIISRDPFTGYKLKIQEVEKDFLEMQELTEIFNKELKIERIANVRDIFIFCCFTGLSYADVKQLTPQHIFTDTQGRKWIRVARQKTRNMCNIPLLDIPLQIIIKYDSHSCRELKDQLLPVLSNQKMNAYLKEIADFCGIKKQMTMHTARHTFATTIALGNGVSIESVAKILGHSDTKMTQHYARVLDSKIMREMESISMSSYSHGKC